MLLSVWPGTYAAVFPASEEESDSVSDAPVMTILNGDVLNIGDVMKGTEREVTLRFRNDGKTPLVILRAFADCGCTRVRYPDEPVEPGDEREILLRYESSGQRTGSFLKVIKLKTNTPDYIIRLYLTGKVIVRE